MRLRDDFDPATLHPRFQQLKEEWDGYNLPADRPGIPNPDIVEQRAAALAAALWPRLRRRMPRLPVRFMESAAWALAAMGLTLEDREEAQWIVELGARHGVRGVSFLEVREAVRTLGSQADVFLDNWTTGVHHEVTGAMDIGHAIWEHLAFMTLTPKGAEKARACRNLPSPPPELLAKQAEERADSVQHGRSSDQGESPESAPCRRSRARGG